MEMGYFINLMDKKLMAFGLQINLYSENKYRDTIIESYLYY